MIPYSFHVCGLQEIRIFIEKNHYSHNVNGLKISHCFALKKQAGELVAACIFGALATTAWKKFATSENEVVELRRLVCVDDTPRNTESWFIGQMLRWLARHTDYRVVVSYADPDAGHSGVIYRASNFALVGMSARDYGYFDPETGKTYHSRALRTKYKGQYKPFVRRLRDKLQAGHLERRELKPKYCYIYQLRRNRKKTSKSG